VLALPPAAAQGSFKDLLSLLQARSQLGWRSNTSQCSANPPQLLSQSQFATTHLLLLLRFSIGFGRKRRGGVRLWPKSPHARHLKRRTPFVETLSSSVATQKGHAPDAIGFLKASGLSFTTCLCSFYTWFSVRPFLGKCSKFVHFVFYGSALTKLGRLLWQRHEKEPEFCGKKRCAD
jgi:hypothetical protein